MVRSERSWADVWLPIAAVVFVIGSVAAGLASVSTAGEQSINRSRDGLAIEGYDPVAYFAEGRAVEGRAEFEATVDGTKYHFVSAENRDRFNRSPADYMPQYGGYCAYAVSRGYTAPVDPQAWAIVEGKLYLNYSVRVRGTWQSDADNNIRKADANWPGLRDKKR